jgi:hypothetical protein
VGKVTADTSLIGVPLPGRPGCTRILIIESDPGMGVGAGIVKFTDYGL